MGDKAVYADLMLPCPPGQSLKLSPHYSCAVLRGIRVDPTDLFNIQFIIDPGDQKEITREEASRLVKYFLAGLTIPQKDIWVNLSPYEANHIITDELSKTDLGKGLLIHDYLLKQLSASLTDPQNNLGQEFWREIYAKLYKLYGTTQRPVNTFHKIWITPQRANVVETDQAAFIESASLNIMLEQDYLALAHKPNNGQSKTDISSQVFKHVILPKIKEEVNHGRNFSQLRQIYYALILALWFKQKLQNTLFKSLYLDQKKIKGIDTNETKVKETIYQQYVRAFKKGVYNYIHEDYDPATQAVIPRHYFSGGFSLGQPNMWGTYTWLKAEPWDPQHSPFDQAMTGKFKSLSIQLLKVAKHKIPRKWLAGIILAVMLAIGAGHVDEARAAVFSPPVKGKYIAQVENGDTYGAILQQAGHVRGPLFGRGGIVQRLSGGKNMDHLKIGQKLKIPVPSYSKVPGSPLAPVAPPKPMESPPPEPTPPLPSSTLSSSTTPSTIQPVAPPDTNIVQRLKQSFINFAAPSQKFAMEPQFQKYVQTLPSPDRFLDQEKGRDHFYGPSPIQDLDLADRLAHQRKARLDKGADPQVERRLWEIDHFVVTHISPQNREELRAWALAHQLEIKTGETNLIRHYLVLHHGEFDPEAIIDRILNRYVLRLPDPTLTWNKDNVDHYGMPHSSCVGEECQYWSKFFAHERQTRLGIEKGVNNFEREKKLWQLERFFLESVENLDADYQLPLSNYYWKKNFIINEGKSIYHHYYIAPSFWGKVITYAGENWQRVIFNWLSPLGLFISLNILDVWYSFRNRVRNKTDTEIFLYSFSDYMNRMGTSGRLNIQKYGGRKPFNGRRNQFTFFLPRRLGNGKIQVVLQTDEVLSPRVMEAQDRLKRFFAQKGGILDKEMKFFLQSNGNRLPLNELEPEDVEILRTGIVLNFNAPAGIPPKGDEHLAVDYDFGEQGRGTMNVPLNPDRVESVLVEWEEELSSGDNHWADKARAIAGKIWSLHQTQWLSFTDIIQDSARSGKILNLTKATIERFEKEGASPDLAEYEFFLRLREHLDQDQMLRKQVTVINREKNRYLSKPWNIIHYPWDKVLRIPFLKEYFVNQAIIKGREEILPLYYKTRYAVYELGKELLHPPEDEHSEFKLTLEKLRWQFNDYLNTIENPKKLASVGRNPSERHGRIIGSFLFWFSPLIAWVFDNLNIWFLIGQLAYWWGVILGTPFVTAMALNKQHKDTPLGMALPDPPAEEMPPQRAFLTRLRDHYLAYIVNPVKPGKLWLIRRFTEFVDIQPPVYSDPQTVTCVVRTDGFMRLNQKQKELIKGRIKNSLRFVVNGHAIPPEDIEVEPTPSAISIVLKNVAEALEGEAPALNIVYEDALGEEATLEEPITLDKERALFWSWGQVNERNKQFIQPEYEPQMEQLFHDINLFLKDHPFDLLNYRENAVLYYKFREHSRETVRIMKEHEGFLHKSGTYEDFLDFYSILMSLSNEIRESAARLATMQSFANRFFHENDWYGGALGKYQRPLMGVYRHYNMARDGARQCIGQMVELKAQLDKVQGNILSTLGWKSIGSQIGFNAQKMGEGLSNFDHQIRRPRKYSSIAAYSARNWQRMFMATATLAVVFFNAVLMIFDYLPIQPNEFPGYLFFREWMMTSIFQNLGLGSVLFYLAILRSWIQYMHAEMGTQQESYSSEMRLTRILEGKRSLWDMAFVRWAYEARYVLSLLALLIPGGLGVHVALAITLVERVLMLRNWKKRARERRNVIYHAPAAAVTPNTDAAMSAAVQSPEIVQPPAQNKGGIDLDLNKYGINAGRSLPAPAPLSTVPGDFEGFRFKIVRFCPLSFQLDAFFQNVKNAQPILYTK